MGRRPSAVAICVFVIFILPAQYAFAWGPLTHIAINEKAYREINPADSTYLDKFVMGGHSPDMVSFWHIVTGDAKYDYAHNLIDVEDGHTILDVDYDEGKNQNGLPIFGKKMLKSYTRTKHPKRFTLNDKYFAYGWTGHQLADRDAHGTFGYATSRSLFEGLPPYVKRIGNHGATELIVDAMVYERNLDIGNYSKLSCSLALLHEAAIKYYNETKYSDGSNNIVHSVKRGDIITCTRARRMAWLWARWLPVNMMLAKMASLSWWWFPEAKEYYSDYVGKYNHSVDEVAAFLENPTYEVAASRPFTSYFASLFNRFKNLFRSEKVQAQEGEENQPLPETLYYTFVNDVAQEAETLGALQTTEQTIVVDPNVTGAKSYEFSTEIVNEEGFQQALANVVNRDLAETNPLETKLWAKFMEGLYLRGDLSFKEITTRAQDFTPPTITNLTPEDDSYINSSRPAIYASVTDDALGIGLDPESLKMHVDGTPVDHSFVEGTNMILYTPPNRLAEDEHVVTLEAADRAGNKNISSWSFTVDTIPPHITHQVQNKIINIKKESKAHIDVFANEPVSYVMEAFRIKDMPIESLEDNEEKILKGEKVYTSQPVEDVLALYWDGIGDGEQPVANGVYTLKIAATDRAGNESSFEEQVNVNNEAGEEPDAD